PEAEIRGYVGGRAGEGEGKRSGQRTCCGEVSRAAARVAVGREGLAGDERIPDDVGSGRIREAGHRRRRHGGEAAGRSGRSAGGEAHAGRAGDGGSLVWGSHEEPLESEAGIKRLFGGTGFGDGGGMRSVQHRLGDAGVDFVAFDAVRVHGFAADVRAGTADRRDGALLEHGQAGANLPQRGGLRACAGCDLRAGRNGPNGAERGVSLGRRFGLEEIAGRILEEGFRAATACEPGGRGKASGDSGGGKEAGRGEEEEGSESRASGLRQTVQRRGSGKAASDGSESDPRGDAEIPLRRDGGDAGSGSGGGV